MLVAKELGAVSSRDGGERPRVTFITDVPTPYIVEELRAVAQQVEITCLFSSQTATRTLPWELNSQLGFKYVIVGGAVIRRRDAEGTDYYLSPRLLWHVARSKPNVVVSSGFSVPTLYALVYAFFTRAKLIVFSDGTSRSERILSRTQQLARKLIMPRAAGFIAKSTPAARRFEELGGVGRIFLARHTTNLAPMFKIARHRTWSEHQELRVLSVGRLIRRKGVHHLLRALALTNSAKRSITLTIVGSGPEEDSLRMLVDELRLKGVTFAGFADQSELPRYYAEADVFAFPTLDDPFGIVLLEAAASGLALVASSHAGATEDLIENDKTGLIFDPQDELAFAGLLIKLADNLDLVARLGRAAYSVAADRTANHTANGWAKAVNDVMQCNRG